VVVDVDGNPAAVLAVGDTLRPSSYRAVRQLRSLGIEPVLVTGDSQAAALAVAEIRVTNGRIHLPGKAEATAAFFDIRNDGGTPTRW
jgi:Cu+-exporting ATPase